MKFDLSINTVLQWIGILLIFSVMTSIGNYVGFRYPLQEALIGMFILCFISLLGLIIEKILPWNIPSILYISIIGLCVALPWSPLSSAVIYYTSKVDLISITAILLAYAGIAMGKDLKEFKKVGIRGIIVTCFVIFGTYFASAIIAQLVLSHTGMI